MFRNKSDDLAVISSTLNRFIEQNRSQYNSNSTLELNKILGDIIAATNIFPDTLRNADNLNNWRDFQRNIKIISSLTKYYSGGSLYPLSRLVIRNKSLAYTMGSLCNFLDSNPTNITQSNLKRSPANNPEIDLFSILAKQTHCIFAEQSIAWSYHRPLLLNRKKDILDIAHLMRGFTRAAARDKLDCFVITLPEFYGKDVDTLAKTTNSLLRALTKLDGIPHGFGDPSKPHWKFIFHGEPYFVLAMGSCYPNWHSRHIFGIDRTFLVFQPDHAFERFVSPSGNGLITSAVRQTIRDRYSQAGMPYDLAHTLSPIEAHKFVKPLEHGVPPIEWWKK